MISIAVVERLAQEALREQQSQFEQKIQEYERNLADAVRTTQTVQSQLVEWQGEKVRHDQKSNQTIQAMKEEYEKQYEALQRQLTELHERGLRAS